MLLVTQEIAHSYGKYGRSKLNQEVKSVNCNECFQQTVKDVSIYFDEYNLVI